MNQQVFPTKGNLINTKKSLELAKLGYELLDKKRNILVREMMLLIDKANKVQNVIDDTYADAYLALQRANITLGSCQDIVATVPVETDVKVDFRSVMGVEIPTVYIKDSDLKLHYGYENSNQLLDSAYVKFHEVKILTAQLAEIENSVYRLAVAIKKTQKRANALKNIMIPRFSDTIKFISENLAEKEREEFSRMKIIKKQKAEN